MSDAAPPVVVLDTNAVLDCYVFCDPAARCLAQGIERRQLRWLATPPMLVELAEVLARPLGARWDGPRERLARELSSMNVEWIELAGVAAHGLHCADTSDQKFLDLALHCQARWLVTRDKDLLTLHRRAARLGLSIVQPKGWAAI